jgi:hypothetical protein
MMRKGIQEVAAPFGLDGHAMHEHSYGHSMFAIDERRKAKVSCAPSIEAAGNARSMRHDIFGAKPLPPPLLLDSPPYKPLSSLANPRKLFARLPYSKECTDVPYCCQSAMHRSI